MTIRSKGMGRLVVLAVCAAATLALAGCSGAAATSGSLSHFSFELSPEPEYELVGVPAGATQIRDLTNATGSDITALAVAPIGYDMPANFLGGAWADGESLSVRYELGPEAVYDVQLTACGKDYTIHDVHFGSVVNVNPDAHDGGNYLPSADGQADILVKVSGGNAYLEYECEGEIVSTLDHERDLAAHSE